jgi:hypothetical protein
VHHPEDDPTDEHREGDPRDDHSEYKAQTVTGACAQCSKQSQAGHRD